jgi:hypothetical protein
MTHQSERIVWSLASADERDLTTKPVAVQENGSFSRDRRAAASNGGAFIRR